MEEIVETRYAEPIPALGGLVMVVGHDDRGRIRYTLSEGARSYGERLGDAQEAWEQSVAKSMLVGPRSLSQLGRRLLLDSAPTWTGTWQALVERCARDQRDLDRLHLEEPTRRDLQRD